MCHDLEARPPSPPAAGGATDANGRELILRSQDGTRFAAYAATHADRGGAGIAILPDVRGLHPFYRDLAVRFAEAGVHATVIDYFGRTAGLEERGEEFDFMSHIRLTRPDQIAADVRAALDHLRSGDGGTAERLYTVGFCFGGRQSFNQAAEGHGLAGVIGFYGGLAARPPYPEETSPIRLAQRYECPVLGLFGGADEGISIEDVEQFRSALDAAAVANDIVIYEGAPHSFFDRRYDEHRDACEDAWRRVLRFVEPSGLRVAASS
jgi:carboxymethylenebutenolidase